MKKWIAIGFTLFALMGCRSQYNAVTNPFGIDWHSTASELQVELRDTKNGSSLLEKVPQPDFTQETVNGDYYVVFKEKKLNSIYALFTINSEQEATTVFNFYRQKLHQDFGNEEERPASEKQRKICQEEKMCKIKGYRFTQAGLKTDLILNKNRNGSYAVFVLYLKQ